MPERQSSTGEETGRPTTEPVGTNGTGPGHDRPTGAPDDHAPSASGDGSAPAAPAAPESEVAREAEGATSAGTGTDGAEPPGGGADPVAPAGATAGSPATNGGAADGTTTDGTGTSGSGTNGSGADATTALRPATARGAGAPAAAVGAGTTGAGTTDAAATGAGTAGAGTADTATTGSPTSAAPPNGAATGAGRTNGGPTDGRGGTTARSDEAAPADSRSDGTRAGGAAAHGAGAGPMGADGASRTATDGDAEVRDTAADDAVATDRTSLFDSVVRPAAGGGFRPSASAAASPAASGTGPRDDDAASTVAIPGRPAEPGRPAGARPTSANRGAETGAPARPADPDGTVQVPLAAAGDAPTRPTPAGSGATQAVPLPRPDAETTQVLPVSRPAAHPSAPAAPVDPPTQRLAVHPTAGPPAPPAGDGGGPGGGRSRRRRPLLVAAAVVALLALLYVADLVTSAGSVPRGTTVAGVDVGGMSLAAAEQELRAAVEPRATRPVPVTAGTVTSEIDPVAAGLAVDWDGTLAQAGDQPLNPITRLTSFFTTSNDLGVVTTADDQALSTAVQQLAPVVDAAPVEGTVRFEDTTPVPVDPVPGQQLDAAAAIDVVKAEWASGRPVALPLTTLPARTTAEDVASAVEDVATPAVSGPVTVLGEDDTEGVLEPGTIAEALSFEPGEAGGLVPVLNPTVVTDALEDQLDSSEQEARDAELDFSTTPPTVIPSRDGRGVDYEATLADLLPVLTGDGPREITAVYADQPADLTTEELGTLGNAGEITRFTTRGFAQDSGINIRRAAELVNGTIVGPGETFSLDAVTGPRTAANGYVEAGVIENGRAGRGIAGGVSQVSTTTYNAAYFAGMTDVEHRPHSFYISRYPEGREATIVTGALDMRFRNDTPTAVLIRTVWTPSDVTVIFYGTKYYDVSSDTSPRRDFTEPNTVVVPDGEQCSPSQGSQGFTVTDTRTLRNLQTGEVTSESQTTRYNPAPRVVCGEDEDE